jgi:cobalamin biosynthesis Co2+ chelatase CbiK
MGMSGGMEKPDVNEEQMDIAQRIKSAFTDSYKQDVKNGIVAWVDASRIIEYMEYMAQEGLDSEDLIEYLAKRSGIDLDTFKQMWAKLTDEQKEDLLNEIAHNIAFDGFTRLIKAIVDDLNRQKKYRKDRGKVLKYALYYVCDDDSVDYDGLEDVITSVFWPENKKKKDEEAYEDFIRGLELAKYLDEETVKEAITTYLVFGIAESC